MATTSRSRAGREGRGRRAGFFPGLIVALVAAISLPPAARVDSEAYAIKDARIVTGAGRTIAKGTVVIRGGLIVDVGENARIPGDARVIDGSGLTVYPGLFDGYTNLGIAAPPATGARPGGPAVVDAPRPGTTAGAQPESSLGDPSASAADEIKPGGNNIEDARAAGVTSALTVKRQGIFQGQSALINLGGDNASRMVVRTPVALSIQFTTSSGFGGGFPNSLMGTMSYIRQSFYDAIHYRDQVERYERVKRGVPRPEYDKKLAALQAALRGDQPVLFLANSTGDIRRALMISEEFKLKPIIAGAIDSYKMIEALKARNVPVILSVDYPKRPSDLPEDEDEPLRVLTARYESPRGAAKLAQAGIKFAFMSGSLRGRDYIANVQKAVENGLSQDDALRALTANAAEILGVADQLGTVENGKIANLVIASGDLFAKDTKVRHVFIDGKEIEIKKPEPPARAAGRPGAPGAVAANPAGDWNLNVNSPGGEITVQLSIRREGDQFTGTLTGPTGPVPIRNVGMTGNQIRFTATIDMGGNSVEMVGTGTIEGDSIRGVLSLGSLGSFDFTGSRPRQ